jgi:allantoicase
VQVKWDDRTRRWYPVAMHLMLQLMTSERPVEFASELLLPFTVESIRFAEDPLAAAVAVEPTKYALGRRAGRCHALFMACGTKAFLRALVDAPVLDLAAAERAVMGFSIEEVNEAASFHGDIGERRATLDARAASEQAGVSGEAEAVQAQLRELGAAYREKFGFKFLIAAKGKSGSEMLEALRTRLASTQAQELQRAREALWTIARQRLIAFGADGVVERVRQACERHRVKALSLAVSAPGSAPQSIVFGELAPGRPVAPDTAFEIASLSKTIGSGFAIEHFRHAGMGLEAPVQPLLRACGSGFSLRSLDAAHPEWPDRVQLAHLMRHEALNMHYVNGVPANQRMPQIAELLPGDPARRYEPVGVVSDPGTRFQYSGGGFMVLEHLVERRLGQPIHHATRSFLDMLGMRHTSFEQVAQPLPDVAPCFTDDGRMIEGGRLLFPAFAAGAVATPLDVARFLGALTQAFHAVAGAGPISHDTAVRMLHGIDRGSREFMGCDMGLGVFTAEAGANRFAVHQGANDGCRALFVHCFAGPDRGVGVVITATGEERAVACIAEVARIALAHLVVRGIDWSRLGDAGVAAHAPAEQRVNIGYRERLFRAFEPDLPEAIERRGALDPLARFNRAIGAHIESVTNQRFARAENLVSPHEPVFDPALFGRQGKIMDSWESVRHNPLGRDTLVLRLAKATAISLVTISTRYHLGNQAQAVEVEGWDASAGTWKPILPRVDLQGHAMHAVRSVSGAAMFDRIRVVMHPDGGLTRLGLFAEDLPAANRDRLLATHGTAFPGFSAQTRKPLTPAWHGRVRSAGPGADLASAAHGARVVEASNEHYGPAAQVISPWPPLHMFDGLESARSRDPGHSEFVTISLARPARIGRVGIDFTHFVNNNPREVLIEGRAGDRWVTLVPRTQVKAHAGNRAEWRVVEPASCEQVRVTAYPDGGMNRIHVFEAPA